MMLQNSRVSVDISPGRGRGVFAKDNILVNEIIEVSYAWEITSSDVKIWDTMTISGFWFFHPDKIEWGLVPLGIAGLVNHSINPNAILIWRNSDIGYIGTLTCIKEINIGQEIFIDYGIEMPNDWIK